MSEDGVSPGYLILGGTGGIGTALATRLRGRGARIHLVARGTERLRERADALGATWTSADATSFEAVDGVVAEALKSLGRLDGVVNCVGSILLKPAHATSADEYEAVLRTNLDSAFAAVRSGARVMRGGGAIVLLASAAAEVGLVNHEAIAAAKAGVIGLARSAAATYARQGVRVNVVAPGLVDTPLSASITGNELALQASVDMHPLGRIGTAEEIAGAIDWLLGRDADWITGQVLGVDGGLASVRGRKAR
jgi:NAD(P)-dependent dehydrogenase (short-subunit alcohol dehydrogenase family)